MNSSEKFTAGFLMTVLLGLGFMIHDAAANKSNCVQSAVAQNYSADQIKKICR